jgi:WD40 repeat protein
MSSEQDIEARIARELAQLVGDDDAGWLVTNPYLRRHLGTHARRGHVLGELLSDPGFLGAAEPTRLVPALVRAEGEVPPAAWTVAQAYLRLGAARVGTTIGQRLANLALSCAADEPDAGLRLNGLADLLPWHVGFVTGTPSPYPGPMRADATEVLALAVATAAGRPVFATATLDHRVRVWDGIDGTLVHELKGHRDLVRVVCGAVIDGRDHLVSAGDDGTVHVWDLALGESVAQVETDVRATALATAPGREGLIVAVGDPDGRIQLRELDGTVLATWQGHDDGVRSLAFGTPEGSLELASGGLDRRLRLWNLSTCEARMTMTGPTGSILGVAFGTVDGMPIVATANSDESVWIWDATDGHVRHRLEQHRGVATCICFGELDGIPVVVSGSADLSLRVWDARTGTCLSELLGHRGGVRAVVWDAERGPRVLSGSTDRTVRVWEPTTGEPIAPAGAEDGALRGVWASMPETMPSSYNDAHDGAVRAVAFCAAGDRRLLASGGLDGEIQVRDADDSHLIARWPAHAGGVLALAAIELDGEPRLVSGGYDCRVCLWDPRDGARHLELEGHDRAVWGVAGLSADGRLRLASAGRDRTVRIWDAESGACLHTLGGSTERMWGVAFGRSGDRVVVGSASTDRHVWIWDADTGQLLHRLAGHRRGSRYLAFGSYEGEEIVVATSADGTIVAWTLADGAPLRTFHGHTDGSWGVALGTCRGREIMASAADDLTVRLWDIASGRALSVPLSSPGYAVAIADDQLAVGSHRHLAVLRLAAPLLDEMTLMDETHV